MRSVNKVILLGNIGRDADTRFTNNGVAMTRFSVATSRRFKRDNELVEETDWHNVVLWQNEKLAPYLTKGQAVYVEGRLQHRSYEKDGEKKYVTEVVAEEVVLCGGGQRDSQGGNARPRNGGQSRQPAATQQSGDDYFGGISDDEVPF